MGPGDDDPVSAQKVDAARVQGVIGQHVEGDPGLFQPCRHVGVGREPEEPHFGLRLRTGRRCELKITPLPSW